MSSAVSSGFTLLEMIVATAIMGIAVVGLLSLISGTLANAARVKQYDRAAMLSRTKMNELLVQEPLPLGQPLSGQWDGSTGWTAQAEVMEQPPNPAPGLYRMVHINLEVWWIADEQRKSVKLDGLRRDLIPMEGAR
ncbi:MAG TPA: type II secretion system protein [Bryobacterales bacterium]|nr:type II secretion system protein [Bryobacterales bacterium]